jgi:hypothetical protein
MGLRGMIAPSISPVTVSDLDLNESEDAFTMTVTGPPVPPYLTAALYRAGLLRTGEEIVGILRSPDSAEISITVKPKDAPKERCREHHQALPFSSEHLWNADIHGLPVGECVKCGEDHSAYSVRSQAEIEPLLASFVAPHPISTQNPE